MRASFGRMLSIDQMLLRRDMNSKAEGRKDESDLKFRISNLRCALSPLILSLCSWMVLVVGGAQVTICDVRINLRGRDVGVSQQSLD